ncbi:hypothetical protein EDD18DRAFT_1366867 [Armillaria luteobubalina]|uniref:Fungal-type protein kinase domain-containing protein n=1 Tax=Armillaria luteobubalina TaxID=153913 RepID=A0AA39P1P6_9AGAR|nr:hypothetical protein EDD18DRAFT_1366867 [Armillaria luteobubalina]
MSNSASAEEEELQTQDGQNRKIDEDDTNLKDDLQHRIFIDFETFLVNILHRPTNWHVALGLDIATVQKDDKFQTSFGGYLCLCDVVGTGMEKESSQYRKCRGVLENKQSSSRSLVFQKQYHQREKWAVDSRKDLMKRDSRQEQRALRKLGFNLYDQPKILHRGISMANIMYRMGGGENVFRVLNDFDLSSLVLIEEAMSLRRTGMTPYMASNLLEEKDSSPHLYHYFLEAQIHRCSRRKKDITILPVFRVSDPLFRQTGIDFGFIMVVP